MLEPREKRRGRGADGRKGEIQKPISRRWRGDNQSQEIVRFLTSKGRGGTRVRKGKEGIKGA